MLIMTRKPGESITIGERVVVRIMEIKGGKVQLGIDAPRDVKLTVSEPDGSPEVPKK